MPSTGNTLIRTLGKSTSDSSPLPWLVATLILLGIATIAWFTTLPHGLVIGDDLSLVSSTERHTGAAGDLLGSLVRTDGQRYRPILQFIFALIIPIIGSSFETYTYIALVIQLCSLALVAKIVWKLSRGNAIVTISLAIAFALSRFAYYFVEQIFGLMEGLALALLLLAVNDAVDAYRRNDPKRLLRTILWLAIAVYTDERYIVLVPFVALAGILHPALLEHRKRLAFFLACALFIPISNYAIKKFFLHSEFLFAQTSALVFDPVQDLTFAFSGFANDLGFNIGPNYLTAQDVHEGGALAFLLGLATTVPVIALVYAFFVRGRFLASDRTKIALAASLYLPFLISASVATRQETRWIYASFTIMLLALAAIVGEIAPRAARSTRTFVALGAIVFAASAIGSAAYYRGLIGNIYYERSFSVARQVLSQIERTHARDVALVDRGDATLKRWTFGDGAFFDVYGLGDTNVTFLTTLPEGEAYVRAHPRSLVLDVAFDTVAQIVPTLPKQVDFIERFPSGHINSLSPASTPTNHGALLLDWPFHGRSLPTLTVLDGYRYAFANLPVRADSTLTFSVAKPLAVGAAVRAFVDVEGAGPPRRLFDAVIEAASSSGPIWHAHSVSLRAYAGRKITLTFGAETVGGNATGAWVAFEAPAIVGSGR